MPAATAEELQTQLTKAEEEKAAAVKRAEKAEAKVKKYTEGEDGGAYKGSKGGKKPSDENDEGNTRKAEKKAARKAARKAAEALQKSDLPPAVRAALEKSESDNAALVKRLEKAEKREMESATIAKEERDRRIVKEHIAKAETLDAVIPDADEFGPVLKSITEKLTKEEAEAIDTILKAADEQLRRSELFSELGKSGAPVAGDALAKLQAKAEELRKSDSDLSADAALQKAMESDPELQRQYLAEVR